MSHVGVRVFTADLMPAPNEKADRDLMRRTLVGKGRQMYVCWQQPGGKGAARVERRSPGRTEECIRDREQCSQAGKATMSKCSTLTPLDGFFRYPVRCAAIGGCCCASRCDGATLARPLQVEAACGMMRMDRQTGLRWCGYDVRVRRGW